MSYFCKLFFVFFIGTISLLACNTKSTKAQNKDITYKVFELENGKWGFQIDVKGKPYIYQNTVPVVEGYKSFQTKEDALKTAEFMVEKIKKEGGLPSISIEEIQSLNLQGI